MTQRLDVEPGLAPSSAGELQAVTFPLTGRQSEEIGAAAVSLCTAIAQLGRPTTPGSGLQEHGVLFESPSRLVVGLGVAARLSLAGGTSDTESVRAVSRHLADIPCRDPVRRPGSSVMATGALAFDPSAPGELVIPEMTYVRDDDGTSWVTVVGAQPIEMPDLSSPVPQPGRDLGGTDDARRWPIGSGLPDLGRGATLVESGDAEFVTAVTTALRHIAANELQKVVLARKVIIDFELPVDIRATVEALHTRETSSTIFAVTSPGFAFVGASPELLVEREGPVVRSVPLAGTVRMTGDFASDQSAVARLIASAKQNLEHRLVVDMVAAQLQGWTGGLNVPAEPEVLWLRQMAHLATPMAGRLEGDPLQWPSALELAASLHPTPAVGGSPRAAALEVIAELEPGGRGLYAGPVGWVDANGNGQFVIGIRSCEVTRTSASVYAGAGIVAGSDPLDELAETSVKLDTILGALSSGPELGLTLP